MSHARFGGGDTHLAFGTRPASSNMAGCGATPCGRAYSSKPIPDHTGKTHHAASRPLGSHHLPRTGDHKGPPEIVFFYVDTNPTVIAC